MGSGQVSGFLGGVGVGVGVGKTWKCCGEVGNNSRERWDDLYLCATSGFNLGRAP